MLARMLIGALVGAALGAAWWGVRELIAAGAVCTKDDWNCLAMGLFSIPITLVVGVLVAWAVFRLAGVERALGMAAVGMFFAAGLTLLTVWVSVPAGGVVAGALGFVLAAPVTARHRVGQTAGRD